MHPQDKQELERTQQLLSAIPEIKDYKSCLYIGASPSRYEIVRPMRQWGYTNITLIEAWAKNLHYWLEDDRGLFDHLHYGDISTPHGVSVIENRYDTVMWWHGPEHVLKRDVFTILDKLHEFAGMVTVIACPWGEYKQGVYQGNPYEEHKSYLYPEDFQAAGWLDYSVMGKKDKKGSNLIAWKIKKDQ